MLVEESQIIKEMLIEEVNKNMINICSSNENFWKIKQPFIWNNVMQPFLNRNNSITNLDIKDDKGVNIVADCANMYMIADNTYDIVLFTSGVEHIIKVDQTFKEIKRILKCDGEAIISAPGVYPRHDDPIDTMLRLPTKKSWNQLLGEQFEIVSFQQTTPTPAKSHYKFDELVFATVVKVVNK